MICIRMVASGISNVIFGCITYKSPRVGPVGTLFSPTHVLFFSVFLLYSFILSLLKKEKKKRTY